MKNSSILFIVALMLFACNSNKDKVNDFYQPEISYFETENGNEVRISLPNGGSKIIYMLKDPIFKSGTKCSYTDDGPYDFENKPDSTYKLVNTSYSKTSGGRFNMIYVYQKQENIIVLLDQLEIQGIVGSEIIFDGNIYQAKEDKIIKEDSSNYENEVKKKMVFLSNDDISESIELIIDGKDVVMEFYQGNELVRMHKGKYIKNELLMDDDTIYELNGDNLCYTIEGTDYCYSKTSEKDIY